MRPHRLLAALLLALGGTGCGPQAPPDAPPKDPPRVFVTVDQADVVGTEFRLKVSVTGCDAVQAISLLEHGSFLKNVPYTSTPTQVTLGMDEVPWNAVGLAGKLSLSARATCKDGRNNTSSAVPGTFFPVESVVDRGGLQVVPDAFVAEGRHPYATFTGCAGGAQAGTTALATVDQGGTVTQLQEAAPISCLLTSVLTPRNAASGKRWLWTYDEGAVAFDAQLALSGYAEGKVNGLGVMPNGDALTWNRSTPSGGLRWIRHDTGQVKWAATPQGELAGTPQLRVGFGVYVPVLTAELTQEATFRVQALSAETGGALATYDLLKWSYGVGDVPYVPQSAFNADASVVYVPVPLPGGSSQVWACTTAQLGGCNPSNRRWASLELVGTPVAVVVPFNNGTRLAAVAPNGTWFLDAATGEVQNKDGLPLQPSGGLVTLAVEKGLTGPDFYLFNGPASALAPPATEVVATDLPGAGELFRYTRDNDSLAGAVDDAGRLWLRVGVNLVRTLELPQYRYVAPAALP